MPLYHFHVHDGVDNPDEEGTELSGVPEARSEALRLIGKIIHDAGMRGGRGEGWNVTVTDRNDMILFRIDCIVTESAATARPRLLI